MFVLGRDFVLLYVVREDLHWALAVFPDPEQMTMATVIWIWRIMIIWDDISTNI